MRNLLQILLKYHAFLLFIALEIIAFSLIVNKNRFQQSTFFRISNTISGSIYTVSNSVSEYFNLKQVNADLAEENAQLHNKIIELENQLISNDSNYIPADNNYQYIDCKVINSTINRPSNYITINKGSRDGVEIDMGVVGSNGVVGIVCSVSNQFAIVETILNNKSSISARIKRNHEVGQLKWNGINYNYSYLNDIARHVDVEIGDTIVTSGYSTVFPENIMLGIIEEKELTDADATYMLKVRLSSNLKNIRYVKVIKNNNKSELTDLEKQF